MKKMLISILLISSISTVFCGRKSYISPAQMQLFKECQEKIEKIKQCTPLLIELENKIPKNSSLVAWLIGKTDGASQTKQSLLDIIKSMAKTIENLPTKKVYTKGLNKQINTTYTNITSNISDMLKKTKRQDHAIIAASIARTTSSLSGRGQIKNNARPTVEKLAKIMGIKIKK